MRSLRPDSSFWRYVVNGLLITIAYFGLASLLSLVVESQLLVSQIAYVPIFFLAFFTHKHSSFRSQGSLLREFAKFALVQAGSFFLISLVLVEAFIEMGYSGNGVFLAIIVVRASLNYFFYRFFVFRTGLRRKPNHDLSAAKEDRH